MAAEICDPGPRCQDCEHLNENGGPCGGCFNEEGDRCTIATSPRTIEKRGPFTPDELDILEEAWRTDNLNYLTNWSKAAVRSHEAETRKLTDRVEELEELKGTPRYRPSSTLSTTDQYRGS